MNDLREAKKSNKAILEVDEIVDNSFQNDSEKLGIVLNLIDTLISSGIYCLQLPAYLLLGSDRKKFKEYSEAMGQEYHLGENWKKIKAASNRWEILKKSKK